MPSFSPRQFTLAEAHSAAYLLGFLPSPLNEGAERFNLSSAACHAGGDSRGGCWARLVNGWVYFHCHKHGGSKSDRLETQRRITANLGLPEYRPPSPPENGGRPYQTREWTYRNPTTGESAVQVVERYDGPCYREDCDERFAHKHPWIRRDDPFKATPTDGFELLGYDPDPSRERLNRCNPCNPCNRCNESGCTEAEDRSQFVMIAEGETTAEAAAACGWRSFSYQGGSNGATRADYSAVKDLAVLIAPDNDRPGTKAALTAAIRCIEAGAREVRIMPVRAFRRRGEDLADLEIEQRAAVILGGWTTEPRQEGPLRLDLAIHTLEDRCLAKNHRPLIEATSERHFLEHVESVWRGIIEQGEKLDRPRVFVRDGQLVRIGPGTRNAPAVIEHTANTIAVEASVAVYWFQGWDSESIARVPEDSLDLDGWVAAATLVDQMNGREYGRVNKGDSVTLRWPKPHHPHRSITNALLDNPPDDVPELESVITHPFLNSDGDRLITKRGYYLAERLHLETNLRWKPVAVETAVAILSDILGDFPFATDADRTTAFAAIITGITRRSYSIAPMFMYDKPKSGTGATLLSQGVSLVTTGKMPKRITYSTDTLEFEKRTTATLRQNSGTVLLDNLHGNFSSSMIAELVTAVDDFEARELGVSRNISLEPRNFVIHATANNATMDSELANRTMPLRLDAHMERPDHRNAFKYRDLIAHIRANLDTLQNAALSLVHHWLEAGQPPAKEIPKALHRFPVWAAQTAAILEAAGFHDFGNNVAEFEERAVSPAEAAIHPFVSWWWDTHQGNLVVAKDLAPVALGDPNDPANAEGMLEVKGFTDQSRRSNLSKKLKTFVGQTFELGDVTVQVELGPQYGNRYQQFHLRRMDQGLQGLQQLQGLQGFNRSRDDTGTPAKCDQCGRPLLPDENGPKCEGCSPKND